MSGTRIFLTGLPGSGKSTVCQIVVEHAARKQVDCKGVLSPAVIEDSEKAGIDLLDLSTGQRSRLANRRVSPVSSGLTTQRWAFIQESVDQGNAILSSSTPCELLVIDELGPLEFERGEGWLNGLTAVDAGHYQAALIVIRPNLLPSAFTRWPDGQQIEIHTPDQAPDLAQKAIQMLSLPD